MKQADIKRLERCIQLYEKIDELLSMTIDHMSSDECLNGRRIDDILRGFQYTILIESRMFKAKTRAIKEIQE